MRRLSFDLVGLPPTPEEVEEFVNDPDPRAYENLVDRLLDCWVGKERTADCLRGFFQLMGEPFARGLKFVCSDMWRPTSTP